MWFKMALNSTAGGVLFGYQAAPMTNLTVGGNWTPALYVGTDGKLRGQYWVNNTSTMITTAGTVNDNKWHHVMLAASTNSQTMYLDGAAVGTLNGSLIVTNAVNAYVGAGKWAGSWPAHGTLDAGYFPGHIAEVAFYRSNLSAADAAAQYAARFLSTGAPAKTITVTDPGATDPRRMCTTRSAAARSPRWTRWVTGPSTATTRVGSCVR